jgi:ribonuclease HII
MLCADDMTAERAIKVNSFPTLGYEKRLWSRGIAYVAGLDEAGRGCWAGPVAAAAVILPEEKGIQKKLAGVRDSKQMSAPQRTWWAEKIKVNACCYGIGFSSAAEIDQLGIVRATRQAMERALACLRVQPQYLLLDYLLLPAVDLPQMGLVHGDGLVLSIAAASILAKTSRDEWMAAMETQYPGYGFARHKGYGTLQHRMNLKRLGVSAIHRQSFAPVRTMLV